MEAERTPKRASPPTRGEEGFLLAVAMMVIAVLLLMGLTFMTLSLTESNISTNEVNASKAFQLAEAGIEHARGALIPVSPSKALDGTANFGATGTHPFYGSSVSLAGGSYSAVVKNNVAAEGFPRGTILPDPTSGSCSPTATKDCDRVLVVTSTGTYRGTQQTVEAIIRVPVPAPGAVFVMNGPDTLLPVEIEDFQTVTGSTISGIDTNPPAAGGGAGSGPNVRGIALQTAPAVVAITADIGAGNPGVTGVNGAGDFGIVPDAMSDADFNTWVATLIAAATPAGTGPCGAGVGAAPRTYGTWAAPAICHATATGGGAALNNLIPDGSTGAGILILNDLDPSVAPVAQEVMNFTYTGIMIVLGDGRFRLKGNSKIYGTVIQKNITGSHSGETRLRLRDDSDVIFSSLAVNTVQGLLTKSVLAWYKKSVLPGG